MNKNKIEEWLRDISTPTGLSYSGDRTLSDSEVDCIINYINELEQKNKEYEKYKSAIYKIKNYINTYSSYFLATQEENNIEIGKIIHKEIEKEDNNE